MITWIQSLAKGYRIKKAKLIKKVTLELNAKGRFAEARYAHPKIHPVNYQASNIEHCIINKNCQYLWSKLKLRKARSDPEIGWIKKGLYRAQFTNVKLAVHEKKALKGFLNHF